MEEMVKRRERNVTGREDEGWSQNEERGKAHGTLALMFRRKSNTGGKEPVIKEMVERREVKERTGVIKEGYGDER